MSKIFEHITRISLFDFDQTLCPSPENTIENRILWENATGREWKRDGKTGEYLRGWWSKIESLDHNVFDIGLNDEIKDHALDRIECLETYSAILTGRIPRFSKIVKEIMRTNGMPYMDDYFFNDISDTETFKVNKMEELIKTIPNVKTVELFEDRVEHFDSFLQWGEDNSHIDFKLYVVEDGKIIRQDGR